MKRNNGDMISIIIPVLNEEEKLPVLLEHLQGNSSGLVKEILVVDGGSTDSTINIVQQSAIAELISSEKGRALQMNVGASHASGSVLYFLHADSLPPQGFDSLIMEQVSKANKAGCFQMKFDKDHWWLNLMSWFTRWNHLSCRGGDQSLFVEAKLFQDLGGFDEKFKIYEDNEFIKRLYKHNEFVVIRNQLTTSARLYEKMGVWNTQRLFLEIYWKRRFGASPEELSSHYYNRINS